MEHYLNKFVITLSVSRSEALEVYAQNETKHVMLDYVEEFLEI